MEKTKKYLTEDDSINDMTLSEIVTKNFKTSKVFEKYELDFCCKGNKNFIEACNEKGVDSETVYEEILETEKTHADSDLKFNDWELDFLVDYIVSNHHNYIRESIPVISAHAEKVVNAHDKNPPELTKISEIFTALSRELSQHLMKEEQILFPYIKNLAKVKNDNSKFELPYFSTVANPIRMMEAEHVSAGTEMNEIRSLSKNYLIPQDACNTFQVFYKELKEFEEDLHKHIYLENGLLFPKSIELENKLLQESTNKNL